MGRIVFRLRNAAGKAQLGACGAQRSAAVYGESAELLVWGGPRHMFSMERDQGCSEACLPLQETARGQGERGTESLRLPSDWVGC